MRPIRPLFCLLILAFSYSSSWGTDADVQRAIPPNTAIVIEINSPGRVFDSAAGQDLWGIVKNSTVVQQGLTSAEADHLRQAARFLETSLGGDWRAGVSKLTAGGVVIAVVPVGNDMPPDVMAVVTSDEGGTLLRFIEAVHVELRRRAQVAAEGEIPVEKPAPLVSRAYRNFECYSVGNGHYAVAGRRLVAANRQMVLDAALDRLADSSAPAVFRPPESLRLIDSTGREPLVSVTVKTDLFRRDPNVANLQKLPSNNPIPVIALGGYFDLLNRAEYVSAGLFVDDAGAELRIRIPAGSEGAFPGLRGYFPSDAAQAAAPLLNPPRTLLSASWYRNYAQLWNGRAELFGPGIVTQFDEANAKQRQQPTGMGVGDLVQLFGPHIRIVAARQQETVYRTTLEERIPAAALAIDLADEKTFREKVLAPADGLVWAVVAAQAGQVKPTEYRGAKVMTIRFAEKEGPVPLEQRQIYQFDPAYTVTRGHLVIGSTAEIVRDVVDELDRLGTANAGAEPAATHLIDQLQWSLPEFGELLKSYSPRLIRDAVLKQGLNIEEAEKELTIVNQALLSIGRLSTKSTLGANQFDLTIRLGEASSLPKSEIRNPKSTSSP